MTNVLKYEIEGKKLEKGIGVIIEQIQSYIRVNGAAQIGPLIQHMDTNPDSNGIPHPQMSLMLQCNTFIEDVKDPYIMEKEIRVEDAMYCRFNGYENDMHFAYNKITLEAYEADERLSTDSYMIFLENSEDEDKALIDIFVPRALSC